MIALLMFPYDSTIVAAIETSPKSVAEVVQILEKIGTLCDDADGLKWFNWLYLQVTKAVQARVSSGGFSDGAWIAALDVEFAQFYFDAIKEALSGSTAPGCWQAMFDARDQKPVARIQFALAGMNAHINHDLPLAILGICRATKMAPLHGITQYNDYIALNSTLDSLIETAKHDLYVRLPGDALPPLTHLEDLVAAWSMSAAREAAWNNAELFWHLRDVPPVSAKFLSSIDGLTCVASKALIVPVP